MFILYKKYVEKNPYKKQKIFLKSFVLVLNVIFVNILMKLKYFLLISHILTKTK